MLQRCQRSRSFNLLAFEIMMSSFFFMAVQVRKLERNWHEK
jgi:hypothetical protein